MTTEPSVPDEVWRDPSFQRLPLHAQRTYLEGTVFASRLTCARCAQGSVIFDLQDDGTVLCRRCSDSDDQR